MNQIIITMTPNEDGSAQIDINSPLPIPDTMELFTICLRMLIKQAYGKKPKEEEKPIPRIITLQPGAKLGN